MAIKVGINGFGRIGRNIMRAAMAHDDIDIVAVNDLTDAATLAHLLKYDSILGNLQADIKAHGTKISVDGDEFEVLSQKDPAALPWKALGVDVVFEGTGRFTNREDAAKHLTAGAKRVIITAPAKKPDVTVLMGVNHESYDPAKHQIVSNASCTTNCLAPVAKVLNDKWGIKRGLMTTVHAMTATQKTVDGPSNKDWRGGRGVLENIIPSSTGAAKAVGVVIPELNKKLTGMSLRVPTSDVSVVDLTVELNKPATYKEICDEMKAQSQGALKGILGYTEEKVVSTDFRGDARTSVFDADAGIAIDPTFIKVVAWYDNEWAYSCKVLEMARVVSKK